jgi:molybdopterin-guanine dinucleotide biosynthesis protein A
VPDPNVCGLLLCGGKSARMGFDKALSELGGAPLMARPLAVLDELCAEVLLACGSRERYSELGRPLVLDGLGEAGPLAGLAAGLQEAARRGFEWVLVLACDMPAADPRLLAELLRRAREARADACLLQLPRGTQPLFAAYRSALGAAARAALERGERRAVGFHLEHLNGAPPAVISFAPERAWAERSAANVNTPDELERARAQALAGAERAWARRRSR